MTPLCHHDCHEEAVFELFPAQPGPSRFACAAHLGLLARHQDTILRLAEVYPHIEPIRPIDPELKALLDEYNAACSVSWNNLTRDIARDVAALATDKPVYGPSPLRAALDDFKPIVSRAMLEHTRSIEAAAARFGFVTIGNVRNLPALIPGQAVCLNGFGMWIPCAEIDAQGHIVVNSQGDVQVALKNPAPVWSNQRIDLMKRPRQVIGVDLASDPPKTAVVEHPELQKLSDKMEEITGMPIATVVGDIEAFLKTADHGEPIDPHGITDQAAACAYGAPQAAAQVDGQKDPLDGTGEPESNTPADRTTPAVPDVNPLHHSKRQKIEKKVRWWEPD